MSLAPIAFFCFNRADKTKQVLDALAKNHLAEQSEIYIFCDGPRNIKDLPKIAEVHQVIDTFPGFKNKHIVKREINHGSQFSIIYGINSVLENHDSVIVVEDDIISSPDFLKFVNQGLEFYKNDPQIWCVTGFNYSDKIVKFPRDYHEDIFFVKAKNSSWGWGTWKDRWQQIDFEVKDYEEFIKNKRLVEEFKRGGSNLADMLRHQKEGKINAWDIQMTYAMFKNDAYTVHPIKPLTKNIGFDASGTHTVSDLDITNFEFADFSDFRLKKLEEIPNNNLAEEAFLKFHQDPFFLIKWLQSKKKRRNFKWLLLGVLLTEIIHLILRII